MKTKATVTFLLVALISTSCVPLVPVTPTQTSIPSTSPPTNSPASPLELETKYRSNLPQTPSGFSWKVIPAYKLAVLVPDGWFFKQQDVFDGNVVGAVYASQEDFGENEKYSTGMAIVEYASDNPKVFAKSLLADFVNAKTTTQVIHSWSSKVNACDAQHLKINATFPDKTESNRSKTIQYSVIIVDSWVYLVVFESPSSMWEHVASDYATMLDHVTVFDE